jgi:DNA-binding GntR family transcriptional regulator
MVVRRTKREIIEMIQVWAALESMAARLITVHASDEAITTLRELFQSFGSQQEVLDRLDEYSSINIAFHQTLIRLPRNSMWMGHAALLISTT